MARIVRNLAKNVSAVERKPGPRARLVAKQKQAAKVRRHLNDAAMPVELASWLADAMMLEGIALSDRSPLPHRLATNV